jgi:hypothetical protein
MSGQLVQTATLPEPWGRREPPHSPAQTEGRQEPAAPIKPTGGTSRQQQVPTVELGLDQMVHSTGMGSNAAVLPII